MTGASLKRVDLPEFGSPDRRPQLPPTLYQERIDRLRHKALAAGYSHVVVYADREHSANIAYLTGFDPRFEEALLVVGPVGEPAVLVGNECQGTAARAPLPMRVHLYQDFSLPGQPRDRSRPLSQILADEGLGPDAALGLVGWKTFDDPRRSDVPSYLVDALRDLTDDRVENATGLLIDPSDGLRVINEVEQLAWFEWAACHTSEAVKRVLFGLRPGLRESEAVRLLEWNGAPLSCHLMLTSGSRATLGLLSPEDRSVEHGDRFTVAYGIWGALNCRAGFVVADADQLDVEVRDYVERLVAPYFEAIVEWYSALYVGQSGGALHEIIARRLGDPFFGVSLNPGHQIHLDEWVNTPITPGSELALGSGMAFQVDVIPATGTAYFTTNIEDGIALADQELRAVFASAYPDAWGRVHARRAFMSDSLGIDLHPDVMPFSNIPAYLPPFLLRPDRVMTMVG
jgi:hypothetical protein